MKPAMMTRIASTFRRFFGREDGLMVAELVIVLPLYLFCVVGMYGYYDAFRTLNASQKASYTVSDMISRTMIPIDEPYINGLRDTMQFILTDSLPVTMRVTSVEFSGVRNRFEVLWSRSPGNAMPRLTTSTLQALARNIPKMADGDKVVIMETTVDYRPVLARVNIADMFIEQQEFRQFIVTKPRFVDKVCLVTCPL